MRRIRKRVKRKLWCGMAILAVQILLVYGCGVTVRRVTERKYESLLREKEASLAAAGRFAFVTRKAVRAGERFTEENTEGRYLLSEQNPDALSRDAIGTTATVDIPEGVILTTALCTGQDIVPSERECLFYDIKCSEDFAEYDAVDIRLRYANGENYCVLKEKRLRHASEDKTVCSFFLTEEEQLLMSSARYDVEVYEGAYLYMVGFREENLQEDARSVYLPSVQVAMQLKEWSDAYRESFAALCESRIALEHRLSEYRNLLTSGAL